MAAIASSLIRSYRLLMRGNLPTLVVRSSTVKPQTTTALAAHQPILKAIYTPPSTILSGFFRPLRSLPTGVHPFPLKPPSAFDAFNLAPSYLLAAKHPILVFPFRAFSNSVAGVQPGVKLGGQVDDAKAMMCHPTDTFEPATRPLANEIVHHIVAARFTFPTPSFDH